MPKMTISVPGELLTKFKKKFPELNLAEVVRRAFIEKIRELEKLEQLKNQGAI